MVSHDTCSQPTTSVDLREEVAIVGNFWDQWTQRQNCYGARDNGFYKEEIYKPYFSETDAEQGNYFIFILN